MVVVYLGIEDVAERNPPQKVMTYSSDARCILILGPDLSEPCNSRQGTLELREFFDDSLVGS